MAAGLRALALLACLLLPSALAAAPATVTGDQRLPSMDLRRLPPGTPVNVDAEQFTFDSSTKLGIATGNVVLTYGPYLLVATRVTYDQNDDIMHADGEVRMREPNGNILVTDLIELRNKFRDGFAEHLRLLLTNDATVKADYAKRVDGNITTYTHTQYTRCKTCVLSDGTPLWQIKATDSTHVESDYRIYHRNAWFELAGVPVFYTPYFSNPDGRKNNQSGLLTPTTSHSSNVYGWGVSIPYIWSLDPSYDITFEPMITSKHGLMPEATWRQRTFNGQYSVIAAGVDEKDGLDQRGFIHSFGAFDINRRWNWGFDYTAQTDDTFARQYLVDRRSVNVNNMFLTGIDDRNYFSARAMSFRNLAIGDMTVDNGVGTTEITDPEKQPDALPYIEHSVVLPEPVLGGTASVSTSFYSLSREAFLDYTGSPLDTYQSTSQTRLSTSVDWAKRMQNSAGMLFTHFAQLRGDIYATGARPDESTADNLTDTVDGDTTARLLPMTGVDLRWPFARQGGWGTHVVTPVAQVITSAEEGDTGKFGNEDAITVDFDVNSLFLADRFTGLDRYEGGTRANTGIIYSLIADDGSFLRTSFGESVHLAGQNSFTEGSGLEGDSSDLVGGLTIAPRKTIQFNYQLRADDTTYAIHSQEASLSAIRDRWTLTGGFADLGKEPAYGRDDAERQIWSQGSLSVYGPWNLFGGAQYDLKADDFISNYVGVGFDCDCMNAKLYYTQSYSTTNETEIERQLLFSIELKTLGATKTISPF